MSLHDIMPFIIGFIIHGEPALFIWLLYFINQPVNWIWICSIAAILSNLSFLTFYFIGYFAYKFDSLQNIYQRLTKRLPKKNFKLPQPLLIFFLRFLFGIRNPIAIIFGLRKYDIKKFALYNFLGSIIWICVWFCFFILSVREYKSLLLITGNFYIHYI